MFQELRLGLRMLSRNPGLFAVVVASLILLISSRAAGLSTTHSELMARPVGSQTVVPLGQFSSVELRNGGKVLVRHGATHRVTLLKGSPDYTQVNIASGDRLVIDKCRNNCPRGYELEVEIVAPDIAGISIADGGTIESRGSFPRREGIRVAVSNGGTIDIRSMTVDSVSASIDQGGRIFTKPQAAMIASVRQGGNVTYWGDAQVISSIRHGGVVTKGTADEASQPLSDFDDSFESEPAVPPLPPVQVQPPKTIN
jgi:putative autotransporter adhesin-like protein